MVGRMVVFMSFENSRIHQKPKNRIFVKAYCVFVKSRDDCEKVGEGKKLDRLLKVMILPSGRGTVYYVHMFQR